MTGREDPLLSIQISSRYKDMGEIPCRIDINKAHWMTTVSQSPACGRDEESTKARERLSGAEMRSWLCET